MIDYTQGDPRLILTGDGSRLQFVGGQPLMDQGIENLALIALFTGLGWCGNAFMAAAIGSSFEQACNAPITRSSLVLVRSSAVTALAAPEFGKVTVAVTNPSGSQLSVVILIEPPASDPVTLALSRVGGVWLNQAQNPAYPKIIPEYVTGMVFEDDSLMTFEDGSALEFE